MGDADNDLNDNNNAGKEESHKQVLESLDPTCNELKHAYDACFNAWFTGTFLKGQHKGRGTPCDDLLQIYSACVKTALQAKKIELDKLSEEIDVTQCNNKESTVK